MSPPYPAQVHQGLQAPFLPTGSGIREYSAARREARILTNSAAATRLDRQPDDAYRRGIMNAKTALAVGVLGTLAGLSPALLAAPPGPPPAAGKVLILDNERAIEGDIARSGEQYCVRRGMGEITFPASKALRLCPDWDEALAFMRSRANLQDPDER